MWDPEKEDTLSLKPYDIHPIQELQRRNPNACARTSDSASDLTLASFGDKPSSKATHDVFGK